MGRCGDPTWEGNQVTERLPAIEEAIEELKRKPVVVDLWPTLAVAYGASA